MRVTLIHNPGAGAQAREDLERLLGLLRGEGHEVRYCSCADEGWAAALDEPADLVAVAGGDGTVTRVAKRMRDAGRPMAILPSGTANNVARALGMAELPLEDLVRGWKDARRVKLDLGVATGPWGERLFVEGIGAGLFACAVPQVDGSGTVDGIDRADARVAYALQLLREELPRCAPVAVRATLDGKPLSGSYVMFEALNLPYIGPNLHLAPDCTPGDGLLDVVLVGEPERERLYENLKSWQADKPRLAVLPTHRGRRLVIEWDGFPLHIDDTIWPQEGERAPAAARIEARIAGSAELLAPA
ncbi:MAG TPA: diacylglycerol kinase family protein [Burkholderiales bacterium]